jgi:hypothetical protein
MGYTVSSLPAYTRQDAGKLIYEKLFNVTPTIQYCNVQTGVKSAETINIVSTQAFWASQACSFSASGADTFSQRTITIGKPQIQKSWCERDLEPKYTSEAMKRGGNYTSLTYNTELIDSTMQQVGKDLEQAIWLGAVGNGNHNLGHFDGFATIINAATIGGTFSGTSWSEANSRTVMKGLAALVAADTNVFRGGNTTVKFFCSPAVAQSYRWKLISDNVGFAGAYQEGKGKLMVEGTNIEIVETPGLAGTNYIYAIEPENMYIGTDLENEYEKYDVWFSQDNRQIRFHTEFKFGCQVAFPTRIYKYLGV